MIVQGDARNVPLADGTVQCVVTSPPYWGLRKYQGAQDLIWGGIVNCDHRWASNGMKRKSNADSGIGIKGTPRQGCEFDASLGDHCGCGAWRGGFGLEPTIEMYVSHSVEILREIRRVLRKDGVVFWNLGDSYFATGLRKNNFSTFKPTYGTMGPMDSEKRIDSNVERYQQPCDGLKPKDLCLIPERVAIAAQADGWWVRSMIIWAKPNPMPESCTDRPTDAYEHILMLTKSAHYYWDADAVREPQQADSLKRMLSGWNGNKKRDWPVEGQHNNFDKYMGKTQEEVDAMPGRNLRNVWTFPTQAYRGAHFATFPEEIPRRCILAATSEKGCCPTCAAPWARVTTGWRPTCRCFPSDPDATQPCLVLDPFGGSGTTARVAVELNRRAVSLDLAYHDHAEARTRNVQRNLIQT